MSFSINPYVFCKHKYREREREIDGQKVSEFGAVFTQIS